MSDIRKIYIFILCSLILLILPNRRDFSNHISSISDYVREPHIFNPAALKEIAEKNHVVGMTVLGYKEDSVRFIYNYGYSDISRKIKVDDKTLFLVASITKTITGMVLMKLVESGMISSIDDDISKYLGYNVRNPKYPDIPITIRHLMTHTAGIDDNGINPDFIHASYSSNPPSIREILIPAGSYYDPEIWMDTAPGKTFDYSNLGAIIAGAIIGKVSGKRYDVCVNDEILKPLGMQGGFSIQAVTNINRIAVLYMLDENNDPYVVKDNFNGEKPETVNLSGLKPGRNPIIFGPQGGLRTRALSLAKVMEIFIKGGIYNTGSNSIQILKKSTVAFMLKEHWQGWGFGGLYKKKGLFIHITDDLIPGVRMFGHKGDAYGLLSGMYFNPELNFGIIFIMNGGDHIPGNSGFYKIEEQVFREAYKMLFNKRAA